MRMKLTYSELYTDWYEGGKENATAYEVTSLCHLGLLEYFDLPDDPKDGDKIELVFKKRATKTAYKFRKGPYGDVYLRLSNGDEVTPSVGREVLARIPDKGWVSIEYK
jgi:hypothetical protein